MLYRRFGRTNLQMPVFSCGGMRYQYKWQDTPLAEIPPENQANLEATIRRSLELGINHIETARGYGSSERQLGVILPKLPREKMIIQTKVGPDDCPEKFTANFEDSLKRLELQYVDLFSIHGINDDKTCEQALGRPGKPGCLAAARAIQKRGLARHIGFSTHAPLRIILDCIRHPRDGGFDYINLHWYWIFQKNWPAIEEAKWRDMGVFIISPADKGGKLYDPPAKLTQLCAPLHPLVFNALFCLSKPEVHTLSIGAARPGDFDLAMQTLEHVGRAKEILDPMTARLNAALAEAVPAELRDPFSLHFPEPADAPGGLNLPVILWLRNLAAAFGMQGYGEMRFNMFGNGGHWFPGQKVENIDKLNLGAVAKTSGIEAERLRGLLRETQEMLGKAAVKRLSQS
ncbi:MAG TPA: aldo/keto reductase [Phycisphaerae bacterium]|nr:aldo/keto reductase [Phycisphaerae bacterium]